MQQETLKGNRLIAQFMGNVTDDTIEWVNTNKSLVTEYQYHKSWDWLMTVVDKIESIDEGVPESKNNFHFFIGKRHTRVIYDWDNKETLDWQKQPTNGTKDYRHVIFDESKIKSTWQAVVDFIEWWNLKLQTQNNNP